MKEDSPLRALLKTENGKASLVGMLIFLVLTLVLSNFFGKSNFGFYGSLICSILSLGYGQAFCREYLKVKDEMDKANRDAHKK